MRQVGCKKSDEPAPEPSGLSAPVDFKRKGNSMPRKSAPKQPKLPAKVQRLMRYLNNGHTLCLHYRASEVGDSKQYWLEPASRSVGSWTVERALELGLIKSNGDGLFADGASQTYSAVA